MCAHKHPLPPSNCADPQQRRQLIAAFLEKVVLSSTIPRPASNSGVFSPLSNLLEIARSEMRKPKAKFQSPSAPNMRNAPRTLSRPTVRPTVSQEKRQLLVSLLGNPWPQQAHCSSHAKFQGDFWSQTPELERLMYLCVFVGTLLLCHCEEFYRSPGETRE